MSDGEDCKPWCGIPEVNVWLGPPVVAFHIPGALAWFCTHGCAQRAEKNGRWTYRGVEYSIDPQIITKRDHT